MSVESSVSRPIFFVVNFATRERVALETMFDSDARSGPEDMPFDIFDQLPVAHPPKYIFTVQAISML